MYGLDLTWNSCENKYRRVRDKYPCEQEHREIEILKQRANLQRNNSIKTRDIRLLGQHFSEQDELLDRIKDACSSVSKVKVKIPKYKVEKGEKFTIEPLFSDLHMGKLTNDFNREVLQRRLKNYTSEILRAVDNMNTEKILIGALGDWIENQTMHGIHSVRGCEFSTAEQIQFIIEDFWKIVLLPLCMTGVKIQFVGVAGNHDRDTSTREYHYPGRHNFTFVIYNSLKMMCETLKFKHITFDIPDIAYAGS